MHTLVLCASFCRIASGLVGAPSFLAPLLPPSLACRVMMIWLAEMDSAMMKRMFGRVRSKVVTKLLGQAWLASLKRIFLASSDP